MRIVLRFECEWVRCAWRVQGVWAVVLGRREGFARVWMGALATSKLPK